MSRILGALGCDLGTLWLFKKVMTASGLLSLCELVRSEVSLQTFALNCCVPETLAEVVLGTVSSTMATVANYGNDHLLVFLVVAENAFETVAEIVELRVHADLRLKNAWLDLRRVGLASVKTETALVKSVAVGGISDELVH